MNGRKFGYIRVSTREQNEDRQTAALSAAGVPPRNIFTDKQSGKDFDRPEYIRMMKKLRAGDRLFIKSIDRLGRNYRDITEQWRIITKERGADITVIDMPLLDTSLRRDLLGSFIADIVLQILSFVAENERDNIRARQAEGIAAAKARGVKFGRREKLLPKNFAQISERYANGELSLSEAAAMCGMARTTFYVKSSRRTGCAKAKRK